MSWQRLRSLLRREVLATFRDPFTVTILIAVPLVALLMFGFVLATDVRHLPLGVHDADGSVVSRRLVAELAANQTFDARPYATRAGLDRALVSGEIAAALVLPPRFARARRGGTPDDPPEVQVLYDGGETALAGNAEGFMRAQLAAAVREWLAAGDGTDRAPPPTGVTVVSRALFNPRLDGKPFMVAGTFGFVLSFLTVLITAVTIVNERVTGTFEQLQVTPATGFEILLAKILPLGAMFAVDVVIMVVVAGVVLQVWPAGSIVFFVAVSAFYVLVSLALGLVVSATSATAAEAVQKSVLFSVPLVQLSGFAFPIRNMPLVVRWIAEAFPATHYIRVSRAIYIRAAGPTEVVSELALLGLFGVLLMAYALRSIETRA